MKNIKTINIPEQKSVNGRPFPLILSPSNTSSSNFDTLLDYIKNNHSEILQQTLTFGALLFRGWQDISPNDFAIFSESLGLKKYQYIGGAAPRKNIVRDVVFTTNESPPTEPIPFHHELAQSPNPPDYVLFYCEIEPSEGGETPIILSNEVAEYMKYKYPIFTKKISELGIQYIRIMPEIDDNTSPIGRSWKKTFLCETREEAEKEMTRIGTKWEWLDNNDLKTITSILPVLHKDERIKKDIFKNALVAAYTGWVDIRNNPKKSVQFGNGQFLSDDEGKILENIESFMIDKRVCFKWLKNDILLIDNGVSMHSRNPFTPPRRILASLGGERILKKNSDFPNFTLFSGDKIPKIGMGCWKISKNISSDKIYEAIKIGYRHIDEACDYGNEKEVGLGILKAIKEGIVKREDLWITSKLWNTYHSPEHVELACKKSLSDLGLEYLDLYLIHFPISLRYVPFETRYPPEWIYDPQSLNPCLEMNYVPIYKTWRAMENLCNKGLVRNIGLCNFNISGIRDILSYSKIPPAVLQVELHPYNQQEKLLRFCKEQGIVVTAFSPLGSSSYVEINMARKDDSCLKEEIILNISKKYNKSPAQILLRWGLQRDTLIIPKTINLERMKENVNIFDFVLSEEDMNEIKKLNKNKRFNDPGDFTQGMNSFYPIYD